MKKENIINRFTDITLQFSMEVDADLSCYYDKIIMNVEKEILKKTRLLFSSTLNLLMTVPVIEEIVALIILYETDEINRFPTVKDFCSYSMLIPSQATSNGKNVGTQWNKMGNHYLIWISKGLPK